MIENLALRQQLATLASRRRPVIRPADRAFWILLRRFWSGWAESLAIVRPDTVVRWHRAGFRIYWNWLSRRGRRSGRPPLPREVRALIRRMATENSWGAPRIHGELLCLGFEVSERSVSRYLRALPRAPRAGQTWTTFLRNHRSGIAAMDFFSVPTATFRVLHVHFIIRHGRRDVVRCAVTTKLRCHLFGMARRVRPEDLEAYAEARSAERPPAGEDWRTIRDLAACPTSCAPMRPRSTSIRVPRHPVKPRSTLLRSVPPLSRSASPNLWPSAQSSLVR